MRSAPARQRPRDDGLLVYVLARMGLRIGEAFALCVRRVDLLRGRLTVAESLVDVTVA